MSTNTDRVQSVRNAWINRVRDEALRMRRTEVSKCVHIGILIATYADADGTNAFPAGKTLATIAGCTEETVTRAVKVLMAVGLLRRKRRPNQSSMYQLVVPLGGRLDWETHLHHYTDTRQARRKKAMKETEAAELVAAGTEGADARNPSHNGVRTPFPTGGPDTVPAGGFDEAGTRSGTGAESIAEQVPEPVPAGGDHYLPTSGRDPGQDQNRVSHSPKPPGRAGARGEEDFPGQQEGGDRPFRRCGCGIPLVRTIKDVCHGCERAAAGAEEDDHRPVQGAFLTPVPSAAQALPVAPNPAPAIQEDPFALLRICGCGREYRDRKSGGRCPDCRYAQQVEAREVSGA